MDYIVIDLETTGLDPKKCEIIEIGAVKIANDQIVNQFQTFVKPIEGVPFEISNLTGITNEMLAEAPNIEVAVRDFLLFCEDCQTFIAHNKNFEEEFLKPYLPFQPAWLDTIEIAQIIRPLQKYYRLAALIKQYEIENLTPHRALGDAEATARLFLKMLLELRALPMEVWQGFLELSQKVKSPLAKLVQQEGERLIKNNAFPSKYKFEDKYGIPMFDGRLLFNNQDKGEADWNWQLPEESIEAFFQELADPKHQLEARPQQIQLSKKVADCFNRHYILLAEAGTGTGKSLAYLLPAALYACGSKTPVFISTNTINLQEQLIHKDIPMLKKYLAQDFSAIVVKGRSNYLCKRKWQIMCGEVTAQTLPLFLRITYWLTFTQTGDHSELNLFGKDYEVFQTFAAHSETCSSFTCPNSKNKCFINNVRKMAAKADIIIINHSLLLSASFMDEAAVLPPIQNLIIDEAHQLQAVAERQLSVSISQKGLDYAVNHLWRQDKLANLVKYFEQTKAGAKTVEHLVALQEAIVEAKNSAAEFFQVSSELLSTAKNSYNRQTRIVQQRQTEAWEPVATTLSNLVVSLQQLLKKTDDLIGVFSELEDPYFAIDVAGSFKIAANQFMEYLLTAQKILNDKGSEAEESYVVWLEKSKPYEPPVWCVCPADIRKTLSETLYQDKLSLVMTSATLANGSFDFFINENGLGLTEMEVKTFTLPSPFDYKRNCRIFLASDISDFTKTAEVVSLQEITDYLYDLIKAANGRALILFTSYQQQKGVYQLLAPRLKEEGIQVLAHGLSGGRDHILESQKTNPKSCILGVNSFWEGVDIKGEALSLLVIVKLPFQPPNTPMMEARFERMQAEGKNPFSDYSLPQAIIRFKQGFGRLIRSKGDKGVFCVLDQRIWSKSYGRKFLAALPDITAHMMTKEQMAAEIADLLK